MAPLLFHPISFAVVNPAMHVSAAESGRSEILVEAAVQLATHTSSRRIDGDTSGRCSRGSNAKRQATTVARSPSACAPLVTCQTDGYSPTAAIAPEIHPYSG